MKQEKKEKILNLANKKGLLRPKDVQDIGLPRQYVYRLCKRGELEKVGRGLYKLPEKDFSENQMLLEVARRVPHATVCLLSALRIHDMTTQNPFRIWIAIHHKDRSPEIDVPLKITRMTGEALSEGREEREIDNVKVHVYNPAKTVADCFKFRNKIGLDVAIQSLREFRNQNMGTLAELWKYARIDRVHNVIQPYVEAQR